MQKRGVHQLREMLRYCKKWSVACRARVKQVKHWTFPNCHSLPSACWERGAEALIPTGLLFCEWEKKNIRVRTPCGHGAQVIIEGKNSLMVEKITRTTNTTQTTTKGPRRSHHHHVVFPLCLVKQVRRKRVSRRRGLNSRTKSISAQSRKKALKGPHFTTE